MVVQLITILCAISIMLLLGKAIFEYQKEVNKVRISFKAGMEKTDFPVITLENNGTLYNFLVDTGASLSVVDEGVLKSITHTPINVTKSQMYGIDGNIITVDFVKINLKYKDNEFVEAFQVTTIPGFDNIEKDDGVRLSGILGCSFFNRYKSEIDFKNLIIKMNEK